MTLHKSNAEDIRGCEEPTAAGLPLVGYWSTFEGDLDGEDLLVFDSCGAGGKYCLWVCGA